MHVDAFVFLSGYVPLESLDAYRRQTGIPAKLVVLTTEAADFEGPVPEYVMRVAGFDPTIPRAIRQFIGKTDAVAMA
jgi:hypothetical protein